MSENTADERSAGAAERPTSHAERRTMSPRLRHIIRQRDLEDVRRSTEELTRRQQVQADPANTGTSTSRRRDWRVVYGDVSGTQTVLPPIEDLVSRSNSERVRATGYRRPQSDLEVEAVRAAGQRARAVIEEEREDRRIRLRDILPPLPDNSDEAVDIEMSNQRMDETEDDPPFTYRYVNPNYGRATDLEVLLGGDDHELDFARARRPSRLRHSATAESNENPPATTSAVREVDASELRWIDSLYQQFPPEAREALSPHVRAVLNRRRTEVVQPGTSARDALWNMMMRESVSDEEEEEEEESDWEVPSSSGEVHSEGRTPRTVGEILTDLMGAPNRDTTEAEPQPLHRPISPTPSRPATNAHLRAGHEPVIVGSSSRLPIGARMTTRDGTRNAPDRNSNDQTTESGPALRRRKSIKRRRIESGMDIPYPYATMMAASSEPIPKEDLPEYMQIVNTPILAYPKSFSPLDKCSRLSLSPAMSPDPGFGPLVVVKFTSEGKRGDADAAAVRTDHPISPACGIYYYEASIVSKGQEGFISIGFSNRLTNLSRLVGWEPGSFAWHMDDGFVFEGRGEGTSKGWPTSTTGDVIGCGIDFTTGQAFFTKNGQFIGHAFKNVGKQDKLYPSVGLRTPGETVQCNFSGPFKYDILEHVRKAQRDIIQRVLQQAHVTIRAPQSVDSLARDAGKSPDPPVDKPGKLKISKKQPAPTPASPQKVVRNIDGALAPAVLAYLQHNGFSASASAMRKDMGSRKRLLETGFGELSESRAKKLARTEEWHEAQESEWQELQKIKTDYRQNRLSSVWHKLETALRSSSGSSFLDTEHLWACRIRIRYFYHIVRETLLKGDAENDTVSDSAISSPELFADDGFNRFMLGDAELVPTTSEGFNCDASNVLVALGSHIQAEHGQSPSRQLQHELETALSYMAYARTSDLPKDMLNRLSRTALAEEAEELVKDIRAYQGKPASSALETAFNSADGKLMDLGRLHNVSAATFLNVREVIRPRD